MTQPNKLEKQANVIAHAIVELVEQTDGDVYYAKSKKALSPDAVETVTGQSSQPPGQKRPSGGRQGEIRTSFVGLLKQSRAEAVAPKGDPWRLRLERVRGKGDYDQIERVSTQTLLDLLEVPQRGRNAAVCRRLATLMRELGWTPIKARGTTQNGFRNQVRGWARDQSGQALL
jgi:hypothetical protein